MLIGLHGKKQAGKDTVHQRIERLLGPGSNADAVVERVSFADLLYQSAAAALGVTVEWLQQAKSDPRSKIVAFAVEGGFASEITVREYLQRYGTEAHRQVFGANFWVDNVNLEHDRKIVVVTDVRFPNEAQAVSDAGGAVVHVIGPPEVEDAGDGHASEETLPASLIDHVLHNTRRDDDFRELEENVMLLALTLIKEGQS